jgi:integrase
MLFADLLQYWLDEIISKTVEETTLSGYQMNVNNHIIPYFKPLKLRLMDLRPIHIQNFINFKMNDPDNPLKATSVQKFQANLKTALDYAMSEELIDVNPARLVKGPKAKKFGSSYYTLEQITQLWKACKGTVIETAVFLTAIYGFRRGEVCGLKWEKVDFTMRRMRIFETRTRGKTEIVKGTKNVASKRTMPLMMAVAEYLKRLKIVQEKQKEYCGSVWNDSGYVVVDELGNPLSLSRLQKNFKRTIKECGLPDVRFHDLRHSVATYLLEIGIPIEEVSAWLGHSSIATTAKVYAHINIGIRMNAALTLDKMMGYEGAEQKPPNIENAIRNLFEVSLTA